MADENKKMSNRSGTIPMPIIFYTICCVIFDAFIFGLPFFGILILVCILVDSLVRWVKSCKAFGWKYKVVYPLIPIVGLLAIGGIVNANSYIGKRNAEEIVKAVESFKKETGSYPDRLEDLVPQRLDAIPKSAYRLMCFDYFYFVNEQKPIFFYITQPPFGGNNYSFEDREWYYTD